MDKKCVNCAHCTLIEMNNPSENTYVCLSGDSKFLFNKVNNGENRECFEQNLGKNTSENGEK